MKWKSVEGSVGICLMAICIGFVHVPKERLLTVIVFNYSA